MANANAKGAARRRPHGRPGGGRPGGGRPPAAARKGAGAPARPADLGCWLRDYKSVDAVLPDRPRRGAAQILGDRRIRVALADPLPPRGQRRGRPSGEPVLYHPDEALATIERVLAATEIVPARLVRAVLVATVHGAPVLLGGEGELDALGPLIVWRRPIAEAVAPDRVAPLLRAGAGAIRSSLGHADLAHDAFVQMGGGRGRRGTMVGKLERLLEARKKDAERDAKRRFERRAAGGVAYVDLLPLLLKQLDDELAAAVGSRFGVLALALGCAVVIARKG